MDGLSNLLQSYQIGCVLQCFLVWGAVFVSLAPAMRMRFVIFVGDIGMASTVCFIVRVVRLDVAVHSEG